jgi:hypothetical protein
MKVMKLEINFISSKFEIPSIHNVVSVQTLGDSNTNDNEYMDLKTCVILDLRKLYTFLIQILFKVRQQNRRQTKYTFKSSSDSDTW